MALSCLATSSSDEMECARGIVENALEGDPVNIKVLYEKAYISGGAVSYLLQDGAIYSLISQPIKSLQALSEMEQSKVTYIFSYWFGLPLITEERMDEINALKGIVSEYGIEYPEVINKLRSTMEASGVH